MRTGLFPRYLALGCALFAAFAAASLAIGTTEDQSIGAIRRAPADAGDFSLRTGEPGSGTRLTDKSWSEKLRRTPVEIERKNPLFGSKNWAPPPPVVDAAPTLPPFPFNYMGRLVLDGGATTVYLTQGQEVYSVKEGDVFAERYRVDRLGANHLEVTYLPLGKKQNIDFSSILPRTVAEGRLLSTDSSPVTLAQAASPAAAMETIPAPSATQSGNVVALPRSEQGATPPPIQSDAAGGRGIQSGTTAKSVGSMVISSPTISQMSISPPTITQMPVFPPTVSQMPTSPPTVTQMPMSAPTVSQMPILAPAGSAPASAP